jgi:MATE family multidrug resistance protein
MVFQGTEEVESAARTYFTIRIWGAPAALFGFAALGWFIGIKHSGYVLVLQILLNGLNAVLDIWFVVGLDMGVAGVAYGTVIAEWTMAGAACLLILREFRKRGLTIELARLRAAAPMLKMIAINRDIFIRTLALLGGFALFNWESARMGDVPLAGNFILLQFISFGAFFLDGFAFAVEALVGDAVGAKDPERLRQAVRKSTQWAFGTALLLAGATLIIGPYAIEALTTAPDVRAAALAFLGFAVLYPLIGVWPFQFDGIFIGATRGPDMRNAMLMSFGIFILAWYVLTPLFGNFGLWCAFLIFLSARAVTLGLRYPALAREAAAP